MIRLELKRYWQIFFFSQCALSRSFHLPNGIVPQSLLNRFLLDQQTMTTNTRRVAIVGAGPVGALMAVYCANRGWNVHLYEARPGIRLHLACPTKRLPIVGIRDFH